MSWLFSRALVVECSEDGFLAGEQFAPLNLMLTAHPFSRRGKTMDASSLSQSGLTCKPLMASHGEELLMSYLEAFHVRTSVPQASVLESMENTQDCGCTWRASWVKYDPNTSSWKTAQCSLLGDSEQFLGTWPRSGSMRNGVCSERPPLDSRINAIACGSSLPTPSGVNGGNNNTMGRIDEWGGSSNPLRGTVIGSMCSPEFEEMVMGWPIGWTAPTPFEMAKYQEWLQQHGIFSNADA